MKTNRNTAKPSIYQTVTDRLLASLKAGVIPWERLWCKRDLRSVRGHN